MESTLTSKLGNHDASVTAIMVDVCGGHPHSWQPRAVALFDVLRLHIYSRQIHQ